ncbi:MAG: hypothetical protein ACM3PY_14710, partial [Omnitrophica WOR_2 bacterium]
WLMKLFLLGLNLYPRRFRLRFAEEMETVFHAGMEEARERGALASFVLREVLRLPVSLADVYVWSVRSTEGGQVAFSGAGGGGTTGGPIHKEGWSVSLLAGLPHLMIGILIVGSALLAGADGIGRRVLVFLLLAVFALLLLGVLFFNIFKGWQRWSVSWMVYLIVIAIALLNAGVNALIPSATSNNTWFIEALLFIIPLALAYLLYKITCIDRLRGLLASVAPMALIWVIFAESVPALPVSLAWGWLFILAFIATVMMLRTQRFGSALGLAVVVPLLSGIPFTYLGVYMGGTRPFTEPGPSMLEVFWQYSIILAVALSIALGPQLAIKLRKLGYASAETGGKIFYRLALGGVLLGLAVALLQWERSLGILTLPQNVLPSARQVGFILAALLYVAGFGLLVWAAMRGGAISGDDSAALRLPALFILLPGVPAVIFLAHPLLSVGHSSGNWLPVVVEIAWVAAAAWLVKD